MRPRNSPKSFGSVSNSTYSCGFCVFVLHFPEVSLCLDKSSQHILAMLRGTHERDRVPLGLV